MRIKLLTLCKNEEVIMPFFIRHYISWVDEINIVDGYSADKSIDIANALGGNKVKIVKHALDTGKEINDDIFKNIRNTAWKENAEAFDWIIVCDMDEFLYHPDLVNKLIEFKKKNITLPRVQGYNMIGLTMPTPDLPLTQQIKKGTPDWLYSKHIIFDPKAIKNINYDEGSHRCKPEGTVCFSEEHLLLLHYRKLSYDYCLEKAKVAYSRMSELNKIRDWGVHNLHLIKNHTEQTHLQEYNNAINVIN